MDNDFTVTVAYITAIAAIVGPVVSTIVNCVFNYRTTRMVHTLNTRIEFLHSFSDAYRKCQYGPEKTGFMQQFYEHTVRLIVVCRKRSTRSCLLELAKKVHTSGADKSTDKLFEKCMERLAKDL